MTFLTSASCRRVCLVIPFVMVVAGKTLAAPIPQNNSQIAASTSVLEDGTPTKIRISRTVSSADAHVGDTVDFEVLEEVKVGSLLLIPKGGVAWATITEAEAKKRMARGGKLNMNIDSVRLVDGEKVALRAVKEMKGGGHTGAMTGGIVATAIVFWPAAPFFLFMHGKDITIPKGTEITAYINGNFPFDIAKFQSGVQPLRAGAELSVAPNISNNQRSTIAATLEILSSPGSADIELDGSFAGNTPSSMGVLAGEHTIRITKSGYKNWERKIQISTGEVKITAELESTVGTIPARSLPIAASPVVEEKKTLKAAPVLDQQGTEKSNTPESSSGVPLVSRKSPEVRPAMLTVVEHKTAGPAATSISNASRTEMTTEGTASITSTPEGADIFIDSVGRGRAPVILKLSPGKHSIQLVLSGYKGWLSDVDLKAGSVVNVTATLEK